MGCTGGDNMRMNRRAGLLKGEEGGVIVTLSGDLGNNGYVTIDNVQYKSAQTLEISKKAMFSVYAGEGIFVPKYTKIRLNGTTVQEGAGTYALDITALQTVSVDFELLSSGVTYFYEVTISTT